MYFLGKKINKLKKKKPTLLLSGGIDSYLAWNLLDKPKSAFFLLQNKNNGSQVECIRKLVKDNELKNVFMSNDIFSYVSDENVFFYIYLIHYALETLPGEYIIFPKTFSLTFDTKLFLYLLKGIDKEKRILLPFLNHTRNDLYELAKTKGLTLENILENTHSCISDKKNYCGLCSHCMERYYFFRNQDVDFTYDGLKVYFNSWLVKTNYKNIQLSFKNLLNTFKTFYTNINT
jgi:7-cyano-7-deazaguanine synthase in queuosine biosynthesis